MKKPASYTRPPIMPNITRLKRVFAFFPTYIDGYMVWFEYYEILQAYLVQPVVLQIDGEDCKFTIGKWTDIAKRIIE